MMFVLVILHRHRHRRRRRRRQYPHHHQTKCKPILYNYNYYYYYYYAPPFPSKKSNEDSPDQSGKDERMLLNGMSFTIYEGQTVAIVGSRYQLLLSVLSVLSILSILLFLLFPPSIFLLSFIINLHIFFSS
jgi:hypothetical protein